MQAQLRVKGVSDDFSVWDLRHFPETWILHRTSCMETLSSFFLFVFFFTFVAENAARLFCQGAGQLSW